MSANEWRRRIDRADELAAKYAGAAQILRFYAEIVRFQEKLYRQMRPAEAMKGAADRNPFGLPLERELGGSFAAFLSVVERSGPKALGEAARELARQGEASQFELLQGFWEIAFREINGSGLAEGPEDFFARAFLQPYAASVREKAKLEWHGPTAFVCPFCKRKPGLGVLRPLGEGSQRSLICSFCLAEWEFRRIVCAGCGEEDPVKLPVYTAEELQHVRVEACESCKTYIKTVDLTRSALGEPMVDEMASVALDLWAQGRGYAKLQKNLLLL
jgi:FdhE protein